MLILALLLNESLDPPRDVHGDGYADFIVTRECDRAAEIASAPARKALCDDYYGVTL